MNYVSWWKLCKEIPRYLSTIVHHEREYFAWMKGETILGTDGWGLVVLVKYVLQARIFLHRQSREKGVLIWINTGRQITFTFCIASSCRSWSNCTTFSRNSARKVNLRIENWTSRFGLFVFPKITYPKHAVVAFSNSASGFNCFAISKTFFSRHNSAALSRSESMENIEWLNLCILCNWKARNSIFPMNENIQQIMSRTFPSVPIVIVARKMKQWYHLTL